MASFLDTIKVKTALHRPVKLDLSCRHTTTTDFFQLNVPYIRHMLPGERLDMNVSAFARVAPMPVPTFGDARLNLRAFFVPYRLVFPAWNDFITDSMHANAANVGSRIPNLVPTFENNTLVRCLLSNGIFSNYFPDGTLDNPDFVAWVDSSVTSSTGYKDVQLSAGGRFAVKVLQQLGYKLCWDMNAGDGLVFNAMPLLAFAKIFIDYYVPAAYRGFPNAVYIESLCKFDTNANLSLSEADLLNILNLCTIVSYDNDYFTSAFDNPIGPNVNGASSVSLPDITNKDNNGSIVSFPSTSGQENYPNTPVSQAVLDGSTISQYAITALRKLTDYMKRHQLVGERAADRFLARFGIKIDPDKAGRCISLGSHFVPLVIGDVMSTADTNDGENGASLGDYAGKGFVVGQDGHFEFKTDEYGMFFVCSSLIPHIGYVQGCDRQNTAISRFDFYTPEFDGLGCQPILKSELFVPDNTAQFNMGNDNPWDGIFGFTPRYAEYKVAKDRLTGDFAFGSLNSAGATSQSWNTFRLFDYLDLDSIVHSRGFVTASDWQQYLRIFYNTRSTADHFYLNYLFKVTSFAPVKPLFDSYDFDDDDGRDVTMKLEGGNVN